MTAPPDQQRVLEALLFAAPAPLSEAELAERLGVEADITGLLHELVLRITAMGMLDERNMTDAAIATVALEELRRADVPPFTLRQPTTELTRRRHEAAASFRCDRTTWFEGRCDRAAAPGHRHWPRA